MKIKELTNKYRTFTESFVESVSYNKTLKHISLIMICSNYLNKYQKEKIKLEFINVSIFIWKNIFDKPNMIVLEAILKKKGNTIIFDMDPIDHFDFLEENPDSQYKIVAEKIKYNVIKVLDT